jgi:hypothetical protein
MFCSTLVLTTPLVLIPQKNNGIELLKFVPKTDFSHSLTLLTKVSFLETSMKMATGLDTLLNKASRWLSLNLLPRLWDFTENVLELFMLYVMTRMMPQEFFLK